MKNSMSVIGDVEINDQDGSDPLLTSRAVATPEKLDLSGREKLAVVKETFFSQPDLYMVIHLITCKDVDRLHQLIWSTAFFC